MFNGLPDDLVTAQSKGLAPWTNPIREDFHVAVFAAEHPVMPGHLLFVPKYATMNVLEDALTDALNWGDDMIASGLADGVHIGINIGAAAGQNTPWPHVFMIPRVDE